VYEDNDSVELLIQIPGVARDDVKVNVEDDALTVRGKRKAGQNEKKISHGRAEIYFGSFNRSFVIPDSLDMSDIDARIEKGVLKIRFAKRERSKPTQIKIEGG
jgi:HSP20 family protein